MALIEQILVNTPERNETRMNTKREGEREKKTPRKQKRD